MDTPTKVSVVTKFPKRAAQEEDQTYLCFEETTPPWDQDLFFIKDAADRNWFCHVSGMELTNIALQHFAEQIRDEYAPRNQKVLQRRLHNPLNVQVVLCRAATLDELRELLGAVKLRPSREAT